MLYRKIEPYIENYLTSPPDKILCIDGARQVGKTFIIRHLAKKHYKNYIEINMADDFLGDKLFENVRTVDNFYLQVSVLHGDKMKEITDTIIFIDEIQVYPHLLTLLKPLRTDNKYRYICSGSLLGVTLSRTTLIPMGAIVTKTMYPLDFEEFLLANSVGSNVIDHLRESFMNYKELERSLHNKILELFKMYLIVGGLPDAVKAYVNTKNIIEVRKIHDETMNYYIDDATKYDLENKLKIRKIYELQTSFIDNKVKRVKFNQIESNDYARYLKYQDEFDYLVSAGISIAVHGISEPKFPLITSHRKNLIKLYYSDVGLLTNLLYKNNINAVLSSDSSVNLGSVYETFVAQELRTKNINLYYYDRRKVGEIDFLIDDYNHLSVLPIEIKSGSSEYSVKAMPKILTTNNYKINRGYLFSNDKEVKVVDKIVYLPIYFIMFL